MSGQKHTTYTVVDLERYHNGEMSAKERHALEKAALDDPFLADAMEGYAEVPVNAAADLDGLNKKLEERINRQEKETIATLPYSNRRWLRIAALFIVVAGAGLLTYQYVLKPKQDSVATTETKSGYVVQKPTADTQVAAPAIEEKNTDRSQKLEKATEETLARKKESGPVALDVRENKKQSPAAGLVANKEEESNPPAIVTKSDVREEKKSDSIEDYSAGKKRALAPVAVDRNRAETKYKLVTKEATNDKDKRSESLSAASPSRNSNLPLNEANVFKGQVLDANNTPLPFANVTNTADNVGTYTDIRGNFVLVSPDSALSVRIRSVGFENDIAKLKNNVANNTIVLQPDTKNIAATVISNRQFNMERRQQGTTVVEEPEPYDGWYYYDTYLANNINVPDEIKAKKAMSGEVELSFLVNSIGAPVDVKIEKSVSRECDAEAVRLLKEGPRWKKKKNNSRARVTVAF